MRNDLAMTSEITLRGRVLPIGGQGEGAGGASRRRQDRNEKDFDEIPQQVLRNVTLDPSRARGRGAAACARPVRGGLVLQAQGYGSRFFGRG